MPDATAPPPPFDLLAFTAGLTTRRREAGAVPLAALPNPCRLAALVDRHRQSVQGTRRAAASLWSQGCCNTLLIPTVTLLLMPPPQEGGRPCFQRCRMAFCPASGLARRLVLCHPARDADLAPDAVLGSVMVRHVTPLIASLAALGRLADRVLWDNAGGVLAWTFNEVARLRPETGDACIAMVEALEGPATAARALTALRRAVHDRRPYERRTCCLRYALPGYARCEAICPAAHEGSRRRV